MTPRPKRAFCTEVVPALLSRMSPLPRKAHSARRVTPGFVPLGDHVNKLPCVSMLLTTGCRCSIVQCRGPMLGRISASDPSLKTVNRPRARQNCLTGTERHGLGFQTPHCSHPGRNFRIRVKCPPSNNRNHPTTKGCHLSSRPPHSRKGACGSQNPKLDTT